MLIIVLQLIAIVTARDQALDRDGLSNGWQVPSPKDSGLMEMRGTIPVIQRFPFTFMAFPSGGKTENGLDLELITKNAAIETNKHRALSKIEGINQFGSGSSNHEMHRRLMAHAMPQEFRTTSRDFLSHSVNPAIPLSSPSFGSFPKRTDFPNSMSAYKPSLFTRPGILPIPTGESSEFVPQRPDYSVPIRNSFKKRNGPEMANFSSESIYTAVNNNRNERFSRNERGLHWLPNNFYGTDFNRAMLRLPLHYNNNNDNNNNSNSNNGNSNNWRSPCKFAASTFPTPKNPNNLLSHHQTDFGMDVGRKLKRLNSARPISTVDGKLV